jgi:hypothetical protein
MTATTARSRRSVLRDSYEEVRRNARLFFSAQDHQAIAVESGAGIVSAAETGMSLVEKVGVARQVAEEDYLLRNGEA